ncbi:MAG: NAD(P)-dependent oxidoreductase [Nocardioidaceae bacterium]
MTSADARAVITVLCESTDQWPPHLEPIEQRAEVRYSDAAGLAAALKDTDALFFWDYFSQALHDAWPQARSLSWIHVAAAGVDKLLFEELIAAPLTEQTRGLFDAEIFTAMRPSGHLVNIGRGDIVNERDLMLALGSGQLAAASLDVFSTEPLAADSPLWATPGLAVPSHLAGDTVGWRDRLARQFADNATRWLNGDELLNVVDKRLGFVPGTAT